MNRIFHIVLILLLPASLAAQKGVVSYQMGIGYNTFSMSSLNDFMSQERNGFHVTPTGEIRSGYQISSRLKMGITPSFELGAFGKFLNGTSIQRGDFLIPNPVLPNAYDTIGLEYQYRIPSFVIGLSPTFSLDKSFNFETKSDFLKRCNLSVSFDLGMGFAFLQRSEQIIHSDGSLGLFTDDVLYQSRGIYTGFDIAFGYNLTESPIISRIGFRCGFGRFLTDNLKDRSGDTIFGTNEHVFLNYSGVRIGTFILIGK